MLAIRRMLARRMGKLTTVPNTCPDTLEMSLLLQNKQDDG